MSSRPTSAVSGDRNIGFWWYAVALAGYVVVGYLTQSVVLNWIVGPLFPLAVLYVVPALWRRMWRWRARPTSVSMERAE